MGIINDIIALSYIYMLVIVGTLMFARSAKELINIRKKIVVKRKAHVHYWIHGLPFRMKFHKSRLYESAIVPIMLGFIVGIFWLTFFSQIGILSFIDTFGAFFGPLFGIMISDFYFVKSSNLNNKDIYSLESNGTYYYTGGWHIKGVYSLILGFVFSASTIWNFNLMFLQSYSWMIGAFSAGFVYYLLAKE